MIGRTLIILWWRLLLNQGMHAPALLTYLRVRGSDEHEVKVGLAMAPYFLAKLLLGVLVNSEGVKGQLDGFIPACENDQPLELYEVFPNGTVSGFPRIQELVDILWEFKATKAVADKRSIVKKIVVYMKMLAKFGEF